MYKRVILKLSGEALSSGNTGNYDTSMIELLLGEIKQLISDGFEVSVVVGGGNYWRGAENPHVKRVKSDYIGMIATAMNALYISDYCEKLDIDNAVMSPMVIGSLFEPFNAKNAIKHLKDKKLVILSCGTGHPFFSTDTSTALYGSQIEADAILMLKSGVDGVYTDDPKKNRNARFIPKMTYDEVLKNDVINVFDKAVCTICMQSQIPTVVLGFGFGNITKAIRGEKIGTIVNSGLV